MSKAPNSSNLAAFFKSVRAVAEEILRQLNQHAPLVFPMEVA